MTRAGPAPRLLRLRWTISERDTLVFLTERLGADPHAAGERPARAEGKLSLRRASRGTLRSIRRRHRSVRLLRENIGTTRASRGSRAGARRPRIPLTVLSAGFKEIVISTCRLRFRASSSAPTSSSRRAERSQCVFRDRTAFGHDKAGPPAGGRHRGRLVHGSSSATGSRSRPGRGRRRGLREAGPLARYCR